MSQGPTPTSADIDASVVTDSSTNDPAAVVTFAALGLPADLVEHLAGLGITTASPIQAATMADLLAGHDVCAAAPTGSGKTIAFAAPLMARLPKGTSRRPAALVLSPTRELAAQIHTVLADMGQVRRRWSAAVYGGVKQGPQINNLKRGVDVLVACPGRLEDLIAQGQIRLDGVEIVVIDEADRMADMGFLPCVRRILAQCATNRQTMLFSATLDGAAESLALSAMRSPKSHSVVAEAADLSRATHHFWATSTTDRPDVCADIIRHTGRTVVFTRTKHGADRLTDRLNRMGVEAAVIHGGRTQIQRDRSLAAFHRGTVSALVATDVAARGIHVDDVACVVHFDLPDNTTDYQHRSGRTARAGASGVIVSLVTPEQRRHARPLQQAYSAHNSPSAPDLQLLLDENAAATGVTDTGSRSARRSPIAPSAQPKLSRRLTHT